MGRRIEGISEDWLAVLIGLAVFIAVASDAYLKPLSAAMSEANVFRQIFFLLTFFAIGLMADLRKLWQEGIGRLAAVYVICLFGFIVWVGLIISWVFFHGVQPPITSSGFRPRMPWQLKNQISAKSFAKCRPRLYSRSRKSSSDGASA